MAINYEASLKELKVVATWVLWFPLAKTLKAT
jgi:hypothetical protein